MARENQNKGILRSLQVKPSKSRGQNFLESPAALEKILDFAGIAKGARIIEIGPGLGVLTEDLVKTGGHVTAIEVQEEFCERLREKFPTLNIIEESVLSVDFNQFESGAVLIGNLPYSLSSSILFHVLNYTEKFARAVFLLQKEFVERMYADVDTSDYGVLTVMIQCRAEAIPGPIVSGDCFFPRTKVESQVVELRFLPKEDFDYDWLHTVVHGAFHQRRKKIYNSMLATQMFLPDRLQKALEKCGIGLDSRPETVTISAYKQLAVELAD